MADARQDQDAFSPNNKIDRTGGEIKSAIKQADPGADHTEWNVFDEQGLDHGGSRAMDAAENTAQWPAHTELAHLPSAMGLSE